MTGHDWLHGDRLMPGVIVVGLGGNLGGLEAVAARVHGAIVSLSETWGPARSSSLYRSAPLGPVREQEEFLNAVAAWRPASEVSPEEALFALQRLELEAGRTRYEPGGPRTLDLDLLLVGQQQRTHEALVLPHPRMRSRGFVLLPLAELFGEKLIWGQGPALAHELANTHDQVCERLR